MRAWLIAAVLAVMCVVPAQAQYYSCGWVPVGVNAWGGTHYEWSCTGYVVDYQYPTAYQWPQYYCPGTVWVQTAPVQCCYGYTYWQQW